jgi:16S rRNA (cytosine967-C5)-methyltransferase
MSVSPARAAAFEILLRIDTADSYASELLHSARFAKLSPADHGLLTELVMGVLRWHGVLDDKIAGLSTKSDRISVPAEIPALVAKGATRTRHPERALGKLDLEVLTALRLGAYQILFLERVPRHAAINESVELVKRARKRSATGLVNAVLRKVRRESFEPDYCSAHPEWLVERWERVYGVEVAGKICEYSQSAPETSVRVNPHPSKIAKGGAISDAGKTGLDFARDDLGAEGIQLERGRMLTHAAVVTAGDITRTAAFHDHRLIIQDEASQLVALLLGRGNAILDCCAAPGGKTRMLAQRNPDASVLAMELHPHRARLLRKLVPNSNVHVIAADARHAPVSQTFDRVLVDAPCTGTGTLARNPEIKWRLTPDDILRMQSYQLELLSSAMNLVVPGGRVVYSTCSLEPEENQSVVEQALSRGTSFERLNCRDELLKLSDEGEIAREQIDSLLLGPYLRTIPGVHACDGFFAAILQKR